MKITLSGSTIFAVALTLAASGLANAQQCSTAITACGCTITASGTYIVDAPLNASQGLTTGPIGKTKTDF
jgi:hypothetical protein